jgi:hypothetical protein
MRFLDPLSVPTKIRSLNFIRLLGVSREHDYRIPNEELAWVCHSHDGDLPIKKIKP